MERDGHLRIYVVSTRWRLRRVSLDAIRAYEQDPAKLDGVPTSVTVTFFICTMSENTSKNLSTNFNQGNSSTTESSITNVAQFSQQFIASESLSSAVHESSETCYGTSDSEVLPITATEGRVGGTVDEARVKINLPSLIENMTKVNQEFRDLEPINRYRRPQPEFTRFHDYLYFKHLTQDRNFLRVKGLKMFEEMKICHPEFANFTKFQLKYRLQNLLNRRDYLFSVITQFTVATKEDKEEFQQFCKVFTKFAIRSEDPRAKLVRRRRNT